MEYKEYLKTDHWRRTRKKFIKKDNHKYCYVCKSTKNLQTHHKSYRTRDGKSKLWNEKGGDLVRLCEECHQNFHATKMSNSSLKNLRKIASLIESGMDRDTAFITARSNKLYKGTVNNLIKEGNYNRVNAKDRTAKSVFNTA